MPSKKAHCYWCAKHEKMNLMFKVRDGPIDWYFCDVDHAELWVRYRYMPETRALCRTLPHRRKRQLAEEISMLFPETCGGRKE